MQKSNRNSLDLLNQAAQLGRDAEAGTGMFQTTTATQSQTKFGSILRDIGSFLTTATDTVVTVDDVINGRAGAEQLTSQQRALLMAQSQNYQQAGLSKPMKTLLIGGVAIGGSVMVYSLLKNKKN